MQRGLVFGCLMLVCLGLTQGCAQQNADDELVSEHFDFSRGQARTLQSYGTCSVVVYAPLSFAYGEAELLAEDGSSLMRLSLNVFGEAEFNTVPPASPFKLRITDAQGNRQTDEAVYACDAPGDYLSLAL